MTALAVEAAFPREPRCESTAHPEPTLRAAVTGLPGYIAGGRARSALTAALASNESHYPPLPAVVDIVRSGALGMNRYPDLAASALRERIADFVEVSPQEVAVGTGSIGVLQQILTSVCDAGDEVVFAWRSFEAYPILTSLAGARPVPVPLTIDEGHDLGAMLGAITARTKVILICTPNNPTGVAIDHRSLAAFLAAVPPQVLVVIDEAYVDRPDPPGGPCPRARPTSCGCGPRTAAEALVEVFAQADAMVRTYAGDGIRITLADAVTNDRVVAVLTTAMASASVAGDRTTVRAELPPDQGQ